MKDVVNLARLRRILSKAEILSVSGWWNGVETVVFKKGSDLFKFEYWMEAGKRKFSLLKKTDEKVAELSNIRYYRETEGIEVKTKVSSEELLEYLKSSQHLSPQRPDVGRGTGNYHFAQLLDVSGEVVEEKTKTAIEKVEEAFRTQYSGKHNFKYGIRDTEVGNKSIRGRGVEHLVELIREKKPEWLRYDAMAYIRHGSFWIDDGSTMGVLHPQTPVEIKVAVAVLNGTEILLYLGAVLEGKVQLSGKKVGQSPENTCPKCGGFLTSMATRTSIYYNCSKCNYSNSTREYD